MIMATDMKQVFRMKEGTDETSYAKTSYIQEQVLSLTKPVRERAIREFYCKEHPTTLCIADLGCSSSESNTLSMVAGLIKAVENARRDIGDNGSLEYQVYLNDLPGNDFNTIFRSLPSFKDKVVKQQIGNDFGHCFVHGTPGSFYDRLFPYNYLHFVHSSYSLHWLSQVPDGIEDNKRNIYMASTSPPNVIKAYYDQFENDFLTFLKYRSIEVVAHGRMVLTLLGCKSNEPINEDICSNFAWKLLGNVLNNMVCEGLIQEKKLNTFNIPSYFPSTTELSYLVEKEGSFFLDEVQVSEVSWEASEYYKNNTYNKAFDVDEYAKSMRSVVEPLLTSHFGETVIEEIFKRYTEIIRVSVDKEKNVYVNVTVSLGKKKFD